MVPKHLHWCFLFFFHVFPDKVNVKQSKKISIKELVNTKVGAFV